MIVRGQVIGALSIEHLEPGAYSAEHIRLLEMIATQAAVAVENARLYALAQQELAERKRMQEALTAGEERLRLAVEATGADVWDWDLQTGAVYFSKQWPAVAWLYADRRHCLD